MANPWDHALSEKLSYLICRLGLQHGDDLMKTLHDTGLIEASELEQLPLPGEPLTESVLKLLATKGRRTFVAFCEALGQIEEFADVAWELLEDAGMSKSKLPPRRESSSTIWRSLKYLKKYFQKPCTLTLVVGGKTGIGKSTLINTLVGRGVCEVGSIKTYTQKTEPVAELEINGEKVTVWDIPGFDECEEEIEQMRLKEMKRKVKKIDLFLLCRQATDFRLQRSEKRVLQQIDEAYGQHNVWEKTVLVVTMGNLLPATPQYRKMSDVRQREMMDKTLDDFLQVYRSFLKEGLAVPPTVADTIPGVVTGDPYETTLLGSDWVKDFWLTCFRKAATHSHFALLKIVPETSGGTSQTMSGGIRTSGPSFGSYFTSLGQTPTCRTNTESFLPPGHFNIITGPTNITHVSIGANDGENPGLALEQVRAESESGDEVARVAAIVRRKLEQGDHSPYGGYRWCQLTDELVEEICRNISFPQVQILQNHLRIKPATLSPSETSQQAGRKVIDAWVHRDGDCATLEILLKGCQKAQILGIIRSELQPRS
eukprot:m.215494 g.215494  ORF g.215494 m.215494 type:complete len:541 (+) comp39833_c3_seq35:505-2127(+)